MGEAGSGLPPERSQHHARPHQRSSERPLWSLWSRNLGAESRVGAARIHNRLATHSYPNNSMIVHNHLKQCFSKAEERVIWLLETEQSPFTVNYHYLSDYKSKFLSYFKSARDKEIRGGVAAQIEALVGGGEPSHRPIASSIMHAPIIPPPNPPPPPTSPFSIAATPAPAPTRAFAPLPAGRVSLSSSKTSGPGTKAAGVVIHQKPSAEDSGDESGSGTGESGEESASEFTKFGASGTGFGNLAPAAPSLPLFAPTAIPFATSSFSFPPPSQPMLATPATAALDAGITKVLTGLTEMGIVGVKPEDLYRILPPDEMEPAIEIMASVRAYFQGEPLQLEPLIIFRTSAHMDLVEISRLQAICRQRSAGCRS